jgi:hypothetical protein
VLDIRSVLLYSRLFLLYEALRMKLFGLCLVAAVAVLSCTGGENPSPLGPSTESTPGPTATPTSVPGCRLGDGTLNTVCTRNSRSELLIELENALDTLIEKRPELFNLSDEVREGSRQYYVHDREAYLDALVLALHERGLCADRERDFRQLIQIKNTNDFSEDFDVLLPSGHVRRGAGAYRSSCSPAAFPLREGFFVPPVGSGCGQPYPPPIAKFRARVYVRNDDFWTLDSTPIVGPNAAYCRRVGYTDGRAECPVRPDGHPERPACEAWRVGTAQDTGRPGPTWTRDGQFCAGRESGCAHHPDNPYQILDFVGGTYRVCASNGVCAEVLVQR